MTRVSKTICFDDFLVYEYSKRGINLTEIINYLLSEHLGILQVKEEETRVAIKE